MADSESEDEIVFTTAQGQRVLRGRIVGEDAYFFFISRRDGEWSVAKEKVVTIRRASR